MTLISSFVTSFIWLLQVKGHFMQAEELDTFISELARVAGGEKHLIEECGDLLSKMHSMQVSPYFILLP